MLEESTSNQGLRKRRSFAHAVEPFHTANNIYLFFGGADRAYIIEGIIKRVRKTSKPIIVGGEAGSGKTMMSLVLADRLKRNYNVVRYEHSAVDSASLLRHLLIEISPQAAIALSRNTADTTSRFDVQSESLQSGSPTTASPLVGLESVGADEMENSHAALESMFASIMATLQQGTPNNKPVLLVLDSDRVPDLRCVELLERLCQIKNRFGNVFSVVLFVTTETPRNHYSQSSSVSTHAQAAISANTACAGTPTTKGSLLEGCEHYLLRRLSLSEIASYLQHHMMLFDFNLRNLFTREMAYFIADRTDGVFKSINVLAKDAFMMANLEGAREPTMGHLLMAGLPQPEAPKVSWYRRSKGARGVGVALLACTIVLLVGAAVVYFD